jgi:predicted aminopeptidase
MFHELAHELLYVKGDTTFNESFAGFVESAGLERWLRAKSDDQQVRYWTRLALAKQEFAGLVRETRRELQTVYASGLPEPGKRQAKQTVFKSLETAYRQKMETNWQGADYFAGSMAGELNNAQLTLMESYEGGRCAFAALYRDAGEDSKNSTGWSRPAALERPA